MSHNVLICLNRGDGGEGHPCSIQKHFPFRTNPTLLKRPKQTCSIQNDQMIKIFKFLKYRSLTSFRYFTE